MLWLIFLLCLTACSASNRFFGTLRHVLVSVSAGILFVLFWNFFLWRLRIETVWNRLCFCICLILIALANYGTYANSCFLRRSYVIHWQIQNPAFGGRGSGILICAGCTKVYSQYDFDSTYGFPGEGWSSKFPLFTMATWNCRSLTFERFNYCKDLGYDVLALTEL